MKIQIVAIGLVIAVLAAIFIIAIFPALFPGA
jgi:hypothetical protein